MNQQQLALQLAALGCPHEKVDEMAVMLDKRAHQLSHQKGKPYEEALVHLLDLMSQGWAAKEKGL